MRAGKLDLLNFLLSLTLVVTTFLFFSPKASANMVPSPEQIAPLMAYMIFGLLSLLVVTPLANTYIEMHVAKSVLKLSPFSKTALVNFLIINFLTYYPALISITTLKDWVLKTRSIIIPLLLAEVLVIASEYFLIQWRLSKLLKLTKTQALKVSILANLTSATIGTVALSIYTAVVPEILAASF